MAGAEIVDLRSDTVTLPTEAMRRAMSEAQVGDDVYGEDPTVRRLEELAASMLGREAAIFVPTGTMGNQIAVHLLARRGTEVILEEGSHVYNYELGAMAAWTGALPRVLRGERGFVEPEAVERALWPPTYYFSRASLLVLENTHNHAGGTVLPPELQSRLLETARRHELRAHLDGARIFNASIALDRPVSELAAGFDTVMFCLSKGLGAPVGSILCGSVDLIREARVVRKRMGGGMRQVGVLAAAGLVALEENVERLREDHRRARRLADAIADLPKLRVDVEALETNMVMCEVAPPATAEGVLEALGRRGVLAGTMGPGRIRFVTHLNVDDPGVDRAVEALRALA
jgi:threonine aldolase